MNPLGLSRREVLASLGGIGVAGAVSGAGTYALLAGEESFSGSIQSGTVSIEVDGESRSVSFDVRGIDRGDSGQETLEIVVGTNPAWLWLTSDCPPSVDRLGDALLVSLRWDETTVASGTLSSIRRSLRSGVLLNGSCTDPDTSIDLELVWELPDKAPDSVAGKETTVEFRLAAEQCRHNDTGGTSNPFAGAPACDEPEECTPCEERVASASFEYDGPDTVTVELVRGGNGAGSGDVFSAETVDSGDSFAAVFHDPPAIRGGSDIDVFVDDTLIDDFHVSCSEPFGPGLVIGDGTYSLTVLEATDTDGNAICEVEQ